MVPFLVFRCVITARNPTRKKKDPQEERSKQAIYSDIRYPSAGFDSNILLALGGETPSTDD